MKFIASSTELYSHLQAVNRVINSKNTLPILDCFLLKLSASQLSVTASDTETTMVTTLHVNDADEEGLCAINAKTLLEALKEIPDQPLHFNISADTMTATVSYRNGQYSLPVQNGDEYPTAPQLREDAAQLVINTDVALDGINRTIFATADDELRPVMNGIYFDISTEDLTMVASDGHKLVRFRSLTTKGDSKAAFILPKKPANLLRNLIAKETTGDIHVTFDDRNAVFQLEGHRMVCRLIEGKYPNYNSVIPRENPYKLSIDRASLIGALRRVSIFSSQASSLIKLKLDGMQVQISAQDLDFSTSAEEMIMCTYIGNPMSIGFKSTFLIEVLTNINADLIEISLADPSRPGVVVPATQNQGEHILMLLMPMMLND